MKKVNNFVAKHNHNRASVHKDRSKEIPRNDKFQEDWLQEMSDIDQELGLYRTIDFGEDNNTTYLSNDAWNKLQEVLDNPPEPNEAMKELMKEFKND